MKVFTPASFLIGLIRCYQFFSRLFPRQCRFYPTCSQYAVDAFSRYGVWRGGLMAVGRLCRCHPWNPGGIDPVV